MMKQHSISERELFFLTVVFVIGTAIMLVPPAAVAEAKQDAWLAMLIGMLLALLVIGALISLQKQFPDKSLVQYSVLVLGQPLGKAIGGIFLLFALQLDAFILRNIGDFVEALILPQTPLVVIHVITIIIVAYAVGMGLEVYARVMVFFFPILIAIILIISLLNASSAEFSRLLPVLENGYKPLIGGVITTTSFPFGETVILAMILFRVNNIKKGGRNLIYGVIIGFIFLELGVVRTITVLGVEGSTRLIYPVIASVGEIPIGNILIILLTLNWFTFAFGKLAIILYAFCYGLAQWLNINDHKVIILPSAVIITALSILIYSNYTEEAYFAAKINPFYKIPIELGIPFLLWFIMKIRFSRRH